MRSSPLGREATGAETIIKHLALCAFLLAMALSGLAQNTPTIKLTSSVNPGINGQPVTFTVTVAGMPGTPPPPVPSGTVTFFDSGTALYSPVTLNASGTAVFTTSTLSAATHSITAGYSGDSNYLPVTSSALSEVVVPAPVSDYTLTAPVISQTVQEGSSTSFSLTITPTAGYNGTITFTCAGLAVGTTCSFSPTSLTPNDTETTLISTLSVGTTGTTGALQAPSLPNSGSRIGLLASFLGCGLLGVVLLVGTHKRNGRSRLHWRRGSWRSAFLSLLSIAMITALVSCGGSSASSGTTTPVGTYTFTVNATGTAGTNGGNTSVHQLSLTLIVTPATSS